MRPDIYYNDISVLICINLQIITYRNVMYSPEFLSEPVIVSQGDTVNKRRIVKHSLGQTELLHWLSYLEPIRAGQEFQAAFWVKRQKCCLVFHWSTLFVPFLLYFVLSAVGLGSHHCAALKRKTWPTKYCETIWGRMHDKEKLKIKENFMWRTQTRRHAF